MFCNSCLLSESEVFHQRKCKHCDGEILICRTCMVGTMNDNYNLNTAPIKYELRRLLMK